MVLRVVPLLDTRPPIRTADLSASCTLIISPGTKKEEFKELLKLITSRWFAAVHNFQRPYLRACPSEVAPIAIALCVISFPVSAIFSLSSTIKGSAL